MQRSNIVCYVLFAVPMIISTANALNCYQCNSALNPECSELSEHPPHNVSVFYQPCTGDFEDNEPFCRKITYKFKFLKSTDLLYSRVIRMCGFQRSQKECYHADNDHHLETVCQCFDDGCNAATRNFSMFSVISAIGLSFLSHLISY